ncbi:MAG: methyltransferase domain-containing protein [Candidatus Paceibacterota bacterium]|jgi:SAM-dependent methyltransferase
MGINYDGLKALSYARSRGVKFDHTATIGRHAILVRKNVIRRLLKRYSISESELDDIVREDFAEPIFKFLGAKKIDSFDFSDYEKATFLQDMNKPIEDARKNSYDLVFDGGTLEHVFNFPVAIKNCMEMVRPGGYFLSVTMANNFNGHGFYQFSPELFFRVFSPENGYDIDTVAISVGKTWYRVKDPAKVKGRVEFRNNAGTYLIVLAKRTSVKNIFETPPFQSDYVEQWDSKIDTTVQQQHRTFRFTPKRILRKMKSLFREYFISYDKKFFKKMDF